MDMKKKLDETYNPDKQGRKERIVIALSGGIDSFVMAYLMKIQKHDLVAVTVISHWEDYGEDQEKVLSCHISAARLDAIRDFTHKLGIPHHIIKASSEFRELVADSWLSARLSGTLPRSCWDCHDLKMHLLFAKMQELGAKKLATGHYAKLFHHEVHKKVYVHTSNDEEHDQSNLLARLSSDLLSHLVLPLSDLTRKEVIKLGENFGVVDNPTPLRFNQCFPYTPELTSIIEKRSPKKYLQGGDIYFDDLLAGSHEGIYRLTPSSKIEIKEGTKSLKHDFGSYNWSDRKLIVVTSDFFKRSSLLLKNCFFSDTSLQATPFEAVITIRSSTIDGWVYPKSLSSVLIELQESIEIHNGEIITVQKKRGKNARVYLSGEAYLLPPVKPLEEGKTNAPKFDYFTDF
jgi:tRNA U34 2-thiouridine synthase MnmA/TrmU